MPSAIEQVLAAIKAPLEVAGLVVETDRDEDEIISESEYPLVALSWGGADIERLDSCSAYFWKAQVMVDCWAKVITGKTAREQCSEMIAAVADVIQTQQAGSSFGGLFHDCVPMSVSDFATIGADTGCMVLTLSVQFQTPKGDWNTILT